MELPIQLKFFRKLEFYQELKDENKKARNAKDTREETWNMEKEVLKFAAKGHHHRGSVLENKNIQSITQDKFGKKVINNELAHIAKNLISRGFADYSSEDKDINKGIIITKEGFLMGRVINDVEGNNILKEFWYPFFVLLVWIFISSIAVSAFAAASRIIVEFLTAVFFKIII